MTTFFSPDGQSWKLIKHVWPLYGGYSTVEAIAYSTGTGTDRDVTQYVLRTRLVRTWGVRGVCAWFARRTREARRHTADEHEQQGGRDVCMVCAWCVRGACVVRGLWTVPHGPCPAACLLLLVGWLPVGDESP